MKSKITSKYQITIPYEIRSKLKLNVSDSIEWRTNENGVYVEPLKKPFLKYKSIIKVGPGNIKKDIIKSRIIRALRYL